MKQFFSESYSKVCLEPSREQLELRWQGIEQYSEKEDVDFYQLVKLFYGLKTDNSFQQEFVKVFNDLDISFTKNNKREICILVGTILAMLMEDSKVQLPVILAVICLSKYNIDIAFPEIVERAYRKFSEISAKIREQAPTYKEVSTKSFADYAKTLGDIDTMEETQIKGLATMCNSIASSISFLTKNQNEMQKIMDIYREDSNILAWICGEWSNELNAQLTKKTTQKSVALILAKELADLISVLPGPYAEKSFLKKMLNLCKSDTVTYTIVEIVDEVDNDEKQKIIDKYSCKDDAPDSTPILYSIKSALESNTTETWKHVVANRMGFDICEAKNSILDWAELMYFECMLIKAD